MNRLQLYKKLLSTLLGVVLLTCFASAQVEVTASGATASASYTTLKDAFDAVNAGTHTGVIVIGVSGDTNETTTAVLNASGAGSASYTAITLSPTGGAARTITGAMAAGSPLLDLSGADNVTIDGLNSGGNSLTIANTTASATTGTCTIRFIGGATGNTITNCNLQGSVSSSVATNGAVVFFSTDAVTANGNDNNTISNNNIGPAGTNLPTKAVQGNGSTTTTAIGNSGIVIHNNNIFDYFGAAVTSSGVATNGGCNTWTITNNRFYQTGTRTWTTGASHRAIDIGTTTATSGAQGFTITGNIIGYASSTQTGTYTLTGAGTGAKFQGIVYNGISSAAVSSISSNTVAAVSLTGVTSFGTTTASPFALIMVQNGLVNTNGNTVGSQSATDSLVFSTTTTTATDIYGMLNFGTNTWTSNNNAIGGISVTNLGTSGTFLLYGMRGFTGSTATWTATSNTVGGTVPNSIQLNATGTSSQVVGMFTSNAPALLTSNTVRNLTSNIGTGTTNSASVIGINITTATPNHTLSQNTIFNLANTNPTAATVVTGIQFTGSTANLVERNSVSRLTVATNSTASEVNGIRVAGGTTVYRNNMIALGAGISNAIGAVASNTAVTGINGINEAAGTNTFLHNSVYIGGSATAGTGASYAFNNAGALVVTRANRNNIFFNARTNSGATGRHYAIKVSGTVANPAGLTINSNLYFANGAGAVFGFFNSLDVASLAAWMTAVGQDANSYEADPRYLAPSNAVPDLHLDPSALTLAEGNGADVGESADFDGQTRGGLTPVDIGADAGDFVGAPNIAFTPLADTASTSNRVLTAVITCPSSGIPTSGDGLPVVYYRKNGTGAYASSQSVSAGGGTYSFVIDYSLVSGVAPGDSIQYYVAAQDTAVTPNVIAKPSGGAAGFTSSPPAASTPPGNPNSYLVKPALSGTFTVGAGGDYPTLTSAAAAINNSVLTGPVELRLLDASYGASETFPLTINHNPGSSAANTITLRPVAGGPTSLSGSVASGALLKILASHVTVDGSNNGTTSRDLTISNTSTTSPTTVLLGSTGTTPIANVTFKNCVVINGVNTSSAIVTSDAATPGAAGYFNNITITNNDVQRAFVGCYSTAVPQPGNGYGLTVSNNVMTTSGANAIRLVGVYVQGVDGATVSGNTLGNFDATAAEIDTGIWVATGTVNSTIAGNTISTLGCTATTSAPTGIRVTSNVANANLAVTGNTITGLGSSGGAAGTSTNGISVTFATGNVTITRNTIRNIRNSSATGFGANGILLGSTITGANCTVAGNFVSDVAAFGLAGNTADSNGNGITVGAGAGYNICFNSVHLATNQTAATGFSTAFLVTSGVTTPGAINASNNIFAVTTTVGTPYPVCVASSTGAAVFADINFNTYFNAANVGFLGGARTTLSAWQAATGMDANSIAADPLFTGSADLHITNTSPAWKAGVSVAGNITDIDGDSLTTPPSIGADQEALPPALAGVSPGSGPTEGGTSVTLSGTGFGGATSVTFGGVPATSFTVDSVTQITAVTPAHLGGAVSVIVTTLNGTNVANSLYTFGGADIAVSQTAAVADGGTFDFGDVTLGGSGAAKTFTITNPGIEDLSSLAFATKDGLNPGDFTVSPLSGASVPVGGGSVTFTVTFAPAAAGVRSAAIHITSNVLGAKNPFDIILTGTGQTPAQAWATQNGVSSDLTVLGANGQPNLLNFAFGMNPFGTSGSLAHSGTFGSGFSVTSLGLPVVAVETSASGADMRVLYSRRKDAASAGLTYTPEFSSDLATWEAISPTPTILADNGTYETVSLNYPRFLSSGRKARFFRVKVTTNTIVSTE